MDKITQIFIEAQNDTDIIRGITELKNDFNISDILICLNVHNAVFYYSTASNRESFSETKVSFDFKRISVRESDLTYRIDSLLYDIKFNDDTVLKQNTNYVIIADKHDEMFIVIHYKTEEYGERRSREVSEFMPVLKTALSKLYLTKRLNFEKDIEDKIESVNRKLYTLQQLASLLQSTLNLEKILEIITKSISDSLGFSVVLLSLYDEKADVMHRAAQHGLNEKVFEKLKRQKVAFSTLKNLMQEQYRISRSYYINHKEANNVLNTNLNSITYILPDEKAEQYINWHPEDILIIPLYSKDSHILGIITVDKPENKFVNIGESVEILESFAQTASLAIENAKLFNKMEQLIKNLERISDISAVLTSFVNLTELLNHLVTAIRENFNYYNVAVLLFNSSKELEVKAYSGFNEKYIDRIGEIIKMGEGVVGWVAENGIPLHIKDTRTDPRYVGRMDVPFSEITTPLKISGKIIGVLNVEAEGSNALDDNDFRIISILSSHLATAIDNTFKYEETERISVTDAMTGMYNYRFFMNKLKEEIERAKRLSIPISVIMIDVDFFKEINDTHGHIVGDSIIKELAELLQNIIRKGDIVTRYGGDEFFIILPGAGKVFTHALSERVIKQVKEYKFVQNIKLTISLGIVTYPDDADNIESLLKWVDDALYDAKRKGRDRIDG
jgi:diguanylate cyclase (GGDEF)-like protein